MQQGFFVSKSKGDVKMGVGKICVGFQKFGRRLKITGGSREGAGGLKCRT